MHVSTGPMVVGPHVPSIAQPGPAIHRVVRVPGMIQMQNTTKRRGAWRGIGDLPVDTRVQQIASKVPVRAMVLV